MANCRKDIEKRYPDVFPDTDTPEDYEECGYCGFDHGYNYPEAKEWHELNDPNGDCYK